ncbi:MAG: hypothetical protein AAFY20_22530 [Cyanobacteria bacterium J06639_14]
MHELFAQYLDDVGLNMQLKEVTFSKFLDLEPGFSAREARFLRCEF